MPKITKDNSANPFGMDSGMYDAKIKDIEVKSGRRGDFLIWTYEVEEPIVDGEVLDDSRTVTGPSPMNLQDENPLDQILVACGISIEDGDSVNTDDAVGVKVRVFVEDSKQGNKTFSKVTKVLPLLKKKKKKAEPEEEEVDTDEEEDEEAKKAARIKAKKAKAKKAKAKAEKEAEKEAESDEDDDFGDLTDFSEDEDE